MAINRPTFSESWYRVVDLRPQLRPTVQVSRQFSRGHLWYVLRNGGNNEHLRLREEAYFFVAMLNGKRSVGNVWESSIERHGDNALTQGEVIQLLSQLYTASFLRGEITPDSAMIFQRFNLKRANRIASNVGSLLFLRIPLIDPDRIFGGLSRLFGWLFSWVGLLFWLCIMVIGGVALVGHWQDLTNEFNEILDPSNIVWMYAVYVVIKLAHESGHGIACKWLGRHEQANEVRTLGVMLLMLMPMPYVDVSSCWMFKSKWRRIVVSCGGVYIELMIAALAACAWANTGMGTLGHTLAYNAMVIASVGSLLFNANPLMRFDGYYALSDWLEIPNLSGSARNFLSYLVRRIVWGVKRIASPAHTPAEAGIYFVYGVLSILWQVWISINILIFIMGKFFFIGTLLAIISILMWVVVPVGRLFNYLSVSPELEYKRFRAVGTTVIFMTACILMLGVFRFGDYWRTDGVVEPVRNAAVYSSAGGFLTNYNPSESLVEETKSSVTRQTSPEQESEIKIAQEELSSLEIQNRIAREEERIAEAGMLNVKIQAARKRLDNVLNDRSRLEVHAPVSGVLVSPRIGERQGSWVCKGERLGVVLSSDTVRLRVIVNQIEAARLFGASGFTTTFRIEGRPDIGMVPMRATVERIISIGSAWLPNAALGFTGGGQHAVKNGGDGQQTFSNTFEVWLKPVAQAGVTLFSGQRVVVRFEFPPRPLALQWYRKVRQILNPHFQG